MTFEKEVDNKLVLAVDENKLIDQIAKVCAKVEKAQDAYKDIMEQTYLLHKYKVHKKYNMSFYDFMREKTGMGTTTCITLVAIWKERIKLIEDNPDSVEIIDNFIHTATMRQLIWVTKNHEKVNALIDNGYVSAEVTNGASLVDDVATAMSEDKPDKPEKKEDKKKAEYADTDSVEDKTKEFDLSNFDVYKDMCNYIEQLLTNDKSVKVSVSYAE